jgi:hypothetical protein
VRLLWSFVDCFDGLVSRLLVMADGILLCLCRPSVPTLLALYCILDSLILQQLSFCQKGALQFLSLVLLIDPVCDSGVM